MSDADARLWHRGRQTGSETEGIKQLLTAPEKATSAWQKNSWDRDSLECLKQVWTDCTVDRQGQTGSFQTDRDHTSHRLSTDMTGKQTDSMETQTDWQKYCDFDTQIYQQTVHTYRHIMIWQLHTLCNGYGQIFISLTETGLHDRVATDRHPRQTDRTTDSSESPTVSD